MFITGLLRYSTYTIVCVVPSVDCGAPPSITNGLPGSPTNTLEGGTVTYSCDPGAVMTGSPTVTCLSSGQWSARPTCTGTVY